MKTINLIYSKLSVLSLVGILFILSSCGTYKDASTSTVANLRTNNFQQAEASIENNKYLSKQRNRLLYLMEKGKLAHINGAYNESNQAFEEAYRLIEDRKKDVGKAIASAFTNPEAKPYRAEDFEKTTLHYYKALNFYQLGEYDNALVEAKRINIKLNRLNDKYTKKKNKYAEDAFSHILQGIIYEAIGDFNNAFIAYRNAADLYLSNNNQYFEVPLPNQLKQDVLRTASIMGFGDEVSKYENLFGTTHNKENSEREAIVFWENGLGPYKSQTKITLSAVGGAGVGTFENEEYGIVVPIPAGANLGINAVAFPKYLDNDIFYDQATISIGNQTTTLELAQNYNSIAKQCLKDRMGREIGEIIIRLVTKKAASKGLGAIAGRLGGSFAKKLTELGTDAVNAATEKADTRNWQSLPSQISYARVSLVEEDEIVINLKNQYITDEIIIEPKDVDGLQILNYVTFDKINTDQTYDNSYEDRKDSSYDDISETETYSENENNESKAIKSILASSTGNATPTTYKDYENTTSYEKSAKKSQFGFGARYTTLESDFLTMSLIEPEVTYMNNSSNIGFSLAYGINLGSGDGSITDDPFESFNKVALDFLLGFSPSFGLVLEGETSTGNVLFFDDNFDMSSSAYSSFGGGGGVYFKGKGLSKINGSGKIILGYDAGSFAEFDEPNNSLYLTAGFSFLF